MSKLVLTHQRKLPDYLTEKRKKSAYNISIRATLEGEEFPRYMCYAKLRSIANSENYRVADCNTNNVIFSFAQMIAHHTRGGCPLRTGDLIATGTLSGPHLENAGCLLEQTRGGKEPYEMVAEESSKGSVRRTFCEDNDTIIFTAQAKSSDELGNVGFGTCQGKVLPAA